MIFALLRFVGVIWILGFVVFALIATSTWLFSQVDVEGRNQRWSARLAAALIWPVALLSPAGRVRLFRGF